MTTRTDSRTPLIHTLTKTIVLAALLVGMSTGAVQAGPPLPPQANVKGKSLAEWTVIQNEWAIADGLGGGTDLPNPVKKMLLLPGSFGGGDFEFDVVIPKGTGIVSSPWFAFGELYEDGTSDDPDALADLIDFIFMERTVDVWLDGQLVQSGTLNELSAFTYGPTFFDAPIPYAEPQDRGPGFPAAVAAIWTVGIGGLYHPLNPGVHTLIVMTDGPVFGPTNTVYNITVD